MGNKRHIESDRVFDMQSNDFGCVVTIRLHLLAAVFVKLKDWKVHLFLTSFGVEKISG